MIGQHSFDLDIVFSDAEVEVELRSSLPVVESVDENKYVVFTCFAEAVPPAQLILNIVGTDGNVLYTYTERATSFDVIVSLSREFNNAAIQCATDGGLKSDILRYSIKCKRVLYLLNLAHVNNLFGPFVHSNTIHSQSCFDLLILERLPPPANYRHPPEADTGFSRTGGVTLIFGLNNEVHYGHKRTLILTGFYSA